MRDCDVRMPQGCIVAVDLAVLSCESCDHIGEYAGIADTVRTPLHLRCSWQLSDGARPRVRADRDSVVDRTGALLRGCGAVEVDDCGCDGYTECDVATGAFLKGSWRWLRALRGLQHDVILRWCAGDYQDTIPVLCEATDVLDDTVVRCENAVVAYEDAIAPAEHGAEDAFATAMVLGIPPRVMAASSKQKVETAAYEIHRVLQTLGARLSGTVSSYSAVTSEDAIALDCYRKTHFEDGDRDDPPDDPIGRDGKALRDGVREVARDTLNLLGSQAALSYCLQVLWGDDVACCDGALSIVRTTQWISNVLASYRTLRNELLSGAEYMEPPPMVSFITSDVGRRYVRDLLMHIMAEVQLALNGTDRPGDELVPTGTVRKVPGRPKFPRKLLNTRPFDDWVMTSASAAQVLRCEVQRCALNLLSHHMESFPVRCNCPQSSKLKDVPMGTCPARWSSYAVTLPDRVFSLFSSGAMAPWGQPRGTKERSAADQGENGLYVLGNMIRTFVLKHVHAGRDIGEPDVGCARDCSNEESEQCSKQNVESSSGGDVVFVHGVGGHPVLSFVCGTHLPTDATCEGARIDAVDVHQSEQSSVLVHHRETKAASRVGELWPASWLAQDMTVKGSPGVRIISVGHDAFFIVRDRTRHSDGTPMQLRARYMSALLRSVGVGECPFAFVCHSLGGVVAQHMLQQGSSTSCTVTSDKGRHPMTLLCRSGGRWGNEAVCSARELRPGVVAVGKQDEQGRVPALEEEHRLVPGSEWMGRGAEATYQIVHGENPEVMRYLQERLRLDVAVQGRVGMHALSNVDKFLHAAQQDFKTAERLLVPKSYLQIPDSTAAPPEGSGSNGERIQVSNEITTETASVQSGGGGLVGGVGTASATPHYVLHMPHLARRAGHCPADGQRQPWEEHGLSLLERVCGVTLISVPNYGSALVDILSRIPGVVPGAVSAEAHAQSPYLMAMRLGFSLTARGLCAERAGIPIPTMGLGEIHPTIKVGIPWTAVSVDSSNPHHLTDDLEPLREEGQRLASVGSPEEGKSWPAGTAQAPLYPAQFYAVDSTHEAMSRPRGQTSQEYGSSEIFW